MFEFKNMLHDEFTSLTFQLTFLGMIFLLGICIGFQEENRLSDDLLIV